MRKFLVTGGAGFIGSNFIRYLIKNTDCFIINVDLLTYAGNIENLKDVEANRNYIFHKGDICDSSFIKYLFEKYDFDVVVNFAAETHVDNSINRPNLFVNTNILGTQVLLECARRSWKYGFENNVNSKKNVKFIQISTDEVYGSLGEYGLFSEMSSISPSSPYSASKASADLIVHSYYKTYGLPINITRCTNNYGPYQYPEKLIPLMVYNSLNDKPLLIYGNGLQIRDWIHVQDHCLAIHLVIEKGIIGEIYNIGANEEHSNIDIVNRIISFVNFSNSRIEYINDRLGHDFRYGIDSSKIRKELKWYPKINFEQGFSDTIQWYIKNKNWINRVKSI